MILKLPVPANKGLTDSIRSNLSIHREYICQYNELQIHIFVQPVLFAEAILTCPMCIQSCVSTHVLIQPN